MSTIDGLVEITNDYGVIVDMQYSKLGLKNAIQKCLVRKEVLERLLIAKSYLPKGLTFKILDAYRPFPLQKELYTLYKKRIIKQFSLENVDPFTQNKIVNQYVSKPIKNKVYAPPHTTGGAIDLTLAYIDTGISLNMGCRFDEFSSLTKTSAYESEKMDKDIRNNRRILYNAMIKAGFTNLPSEFWHYDYGNKNWCYYKHKKIKYKGIW